MPWVGDRRGAYVEAVYRLNRTWDIGYRFDKLWAIGERRRSPAISIRCATASRLTWRNSEFSFFRLQYSHDEAEPNLTDNAIYLQYDVASARTARTSSDAATSTHSREHR